jgi:hypothetical protein
MGGPLAVEHLAFWPGRLLPARVAAAPTVKLPAQDRRPVTNVMIHHA